MLYVTYRQAEIALEEAEQDVAGDFGEEAVEAGYSDLVHSIASMSSPEVGAELIQRKLGV